MFTAVIQVFKGSGKYKSDPTFRRCLPLQGKYLKISPNVLALIFGRSLTLNSTGTLSIPSEEFNFLSPSRQIPGIFLKIFHSRFFTIVLNSSSHIFFPL
jgi:hypothetical protein